MFGRHKHFLAVSSAVWFNSVVFSFIPIPSIEAKQNSDEIEHRRNPRKATFQTQSDFTETTFPFGSPAAPQHCKYLRFSIYFSWDFIALLLPYILGQPYKTATSAERLLLEFNYRFSCTLGLQRKAVLVPGS